MASFYDQQVEVKVKKIKAYIEEQCEERGIELDEILTSASYPEGTITVYLEDCSSYNLGRISAFVKSKWPDIECEAENSFEIEFRFRI